jgi:hypothetical protein
MSESTHLRSEKQTVPAVESPDGSTVDAIVKALYESVSFPPGKQPDYTRLRSLFHREGRVIPPKVDKSAATVILDVPSFITRSWEYVVTTGMERKGFTEREIARRVDAYGNMVHVFSTYESRHLPEDAAIIQRGINSIQLVRDSNRWWIASIVWDLERPTNPIPKRYTI